MNKDAKEFVIIEMNHDDIADNNIRFAYESEVTFLEYRGIPFKRVVYKFSIKVAGCAKFSLQNAKKIVYELVKNNHLNLKNMNDIIYDSITDFRKHFESLYRQLITTEMSGLFIVRMTEQEEKELVLKDIL